jgi:hypothetical protein
VVERGQKETNGETIEGTNEKGDRGMEPRGETVDGNRTGTTLVSPTHLVIGGLEYATLQFIPTRLDGRTQAL